jgi:uncharacterized membrane protein
MIISQLFSGLLFYLVFCLFAFIGFYATRRIFPGRMLAYVTSKPVGLIIVGYAVWLLGFLHVLDYQWRSVIWTAFALLSAAALYASRREWRQLRGHLKKIFLTEALTIVVYLLYLVLRSHNASANNGAESFMDMTLLTGASKTHFFPFLDSWYAGKTINYYYYGSYLMSLLGNLSHIPTYLSYNFSLGLIYCQSILLSASLVYALCKSKVASFVGAFLVTSAGTLFFANCTIQAWFSGAVKTCSYATSTRLYSPSYIINEIPSYSFIVGDLHAHLLALPFFLVNLILLFALSRTDKPSAILFGTLAVSLATSGMINAWDGISLMCLSAIVMIFKFWKSRIKAWFGRAALLVAATLFLMWPALATFQSPVLGIGFAPTYVVAHELKGVQYPTPLPAEAGMWGVFVVGLAAAFILKKRFSSFGLFAASLCVLSLGIIVGVEFFFVKDIYSVSNPPYFRANTTFKFGYHAWTMLSIIFAAVMGDWFFPQKKEDRHHSRFVGAAFILVALGAGIYFPYQAKAQYYSGDKRIGLDLDASLWMKRSAPEDYNVVQYINSAISDRAVIAEAVGDSYTTYGRISAYTGMIAPMGWKTHEWTWRFQGKGAENAPKGQTVETGYGAIAVVAEDIKRLYITKDATEAELVIKRYGIQYVFVGGLEYRTYPDLDLEKFDAIGKRVFESGGSILFKVTSQ